jgi:hypothetical protein
VLADVRIVGEHEAHERVKEDIEAADISQEVGCAVL